MTYKDFAAWLQGVIESNPEGLNDKQLKIISEKISKLTFPTSNSTTNMRC